MAHAVGDSHEHAIYGAHLLVTFPLLDADGDPISPSSPDSQVSTDLGTFTACTNEAVELTTSSGSCYLYLTGAELTGSIATVQIKSTGAKTTVLSIPIVRLPILASGTAQAGAGSTITLAASTSKVDNDLAGLFVRITNNSPSGAQYQTRRIISNVASTQVATVDAAWGTNPSSASTYDLLAPTTSNVSSFAGTLPPAIATAGYPDVNAKFHGGTLQTGRDIGTSVLLSSGTGTGQLKLASGYVAMTWADIAAATTTVGLSGTTIKTATDMATATTDIQNRLPAALTVGGSIKADALAMNGVSTSSVITVNANQGTTQPVNFSGTGGSALVKSDLEASNGSAIFASDFTVASATSTTITLPTTFTNGNALPNDASHLGKVLLVVGGVGAGQIIVLSARVGSTREWTVSGMVTQLDNTSECDQIGTTAGDAGSIADGILARNIAGGSNTGRTVKQALAFLRNKWVSSGGVLTVYDTDDTTVLWTSALTGDSASQPVVGSDPS